MAEVGCSLCREGNEGFSASGMSMGGDAASPAVCTRAAIQSRKHIGKIAAERSCEPPGAFPKRSASDRLNAPREFPVPASARDAPSARHRSGHIAVRQNRQTALLQQPLQPLLKRRRHGRRQLAVCDPQWLLSSLLRFSSHRPARSLRTVAVDRVTKFFFRNPDFHHGLLSPAVSLRGSPLPLR